MDAESRATVNRKAREEKKRAYLQGIFVRHREGLGVLVGKDPLVQALHVHETMDAILESERAKSAADRDIRCRRGCDHCCKVAVEIIPQEASRLLDAAREAGMRLDEARLERQSRYGIDDWRTQPASDRACVFLGEDGACRVYHARPGACRKLLVTSAPELCDESRHSAAEIERWFSWNAEMLQAAGVELFGASLMPRALLAALRAQQSKG